MIQIIEELKPSHRYSVIGQIVDTVNAINYHHKEINPNFYKMESWERKEYEKTYSSYKEEYKTLRTYMIANEPIFNKSLSEYNLSVATFLASQRDRIK